MGKYQTQYHQQVLETLNQVFLHEQESIQQAATLFADTVRAQGVIYGFGAGHSFAAAIELAGRAGGLVNTRALEQFYGHLGWLDALEGSGDVFSRLIDLRPDDCMVIISNSGTKPLHIELARAAHEKGVAVICLTSGTQPTTGEGMRAYANVVIGNGSPLTDCTLSLDSGRLMTGPVSSISNAYIINSIVIETITMLLDQGIEPPVMRSINQSGGKEFNDALISQYRTRVFTV